MENLENELPQQPNTEAVNEPQELPQSQPSAVEQPQSFYHGSGVGQRETPYATYIPYQAPYQQPYQQPVQSAPERPEPKKQKKAGKVFRAVCACVLTAALVVTGCGVTAGICNRYWKNQNELILQNMEDKVAALQQQLEEQKGNAGGAGTLDPGKTLTAAQIYQQNVNSVVAITCTVRVNSGGQVQEGQNSGTGFVISEDGYIVTNHHVVEGASRIFITLANGTRYAADIIGSDKTNDVALIKSRVGGLDPVALGSSGAMQVGDQVVAIGNALGELSSSLTVGYISGINRSIATDGTVINMIQTDAAINSGNSGGPLFNAKGEVIGITTAKYSGTTTSGASIEGISFAIPLDDVIDMIDDLRVYGYIKSAYLGVLVREVDAVIAETYNLPLGVYVEEVTAGSCAEKAGVRAKDIIVELGGYTVRTLNDLSRALRAHEGGQTVTIVVWRSGQKLILNITLDEKPAQ